MIYNLSVRSMEANPLHDEKFYVETNTLTSEEVVNILQKRTFYKVFFLSVIRKPGKIARCKREHTVLSIEEAADRVSSIKLMHVKTTLHECVYRTLAAKFYFKPFRVSVSQYLGRYYSFFEDCKITLEGLRELPTLEDTFMARSNTPCVNAAYELCKEGDIYALYRLIICDVEKRSVERAFK